MLPGPRVIRKVIISPIHVGANTLSGGPHLTGEVHLGPSSESYTDFINLSEITDTAFLDLDPGLFTSGRVVGWQWECHRNSLSQDQEHCHLF